jgi:proteasome lid subunit RPN8/RPN11
MQAFSINDLTEELREALRADAQAAYPAECCGLLVSEFSTGLPCYLPCRNIAAGAQARDSFVLDPQDWCDAEEIGRVLAVVHSHPDASANPSTADRVHCERSGLPWLIVGWPSGVIVELQPSGWQAPLVGREFVFGVLDCYTLIQDHFQRELGVALPDFERSDDFWTRGEELYLQGFEAAGFRQVQGTPQRHDVILMQVASRVTNHGAVYLGDGTMLHHLYGQLSTRDVYGGYWLRHTRMVVRHSSLMGAEA